jgi:hypothetical protein
MNCCRGVRFTVLSLLASIACLGCATSLQPLVSADVRTDVTGITGRWVLEQSNTSTIEVGAKLRIDRRGLGSHHVEIDQAGEKSSWNADTLKLGETIFVDLFPDFESDTEKPEGILIIATHVFMVVRMNKNSLELYGFDHANLDAQAIKENVVVPSPRNNRLVFTAAPERLQEFFAKHGAANLQKQPTLIFKKER